MTRKQSYYTLVVMCVALLALATNAIVSVANTRHLVVREDWVEHTQEVLTQVQAIFADVTNSVAAQRAYLLTGDERRLAVMNASRDDGRQKIAELRQLINDMPPQIDRTEKLLAAAEKTFATLNAGVAQRRDGSLKPPILPANFDDSKASLDQLRSLVKEMSAFERDRMDERKAAVHSALHTTLVTLGIASLVAMGTVVLAFVLLRMGVRTSLRAAAEQNRLANYNTLLVNSTGEGMYGIDLGGNCTFINKAAEKILLVKAANVIGKRMHDITHHHKPDGTPYPAADCPIYKAYITGEGCRVDNELFFRSDGTSFPVEYSANPILVGGRVEGAVVSFNDITQPPMVRLHRHDDGGDEGLWLEKSSSS